MKLKVKLSELFGGKVPRDNTFREAVGQAIIDTILERTGSGKDRKGKPFEKYSDEYMDSQDFDASGKGSTPNLRLTGDMLDQLDITNIDGNTIEIGWDETLENNKAHGHVTGGGNLPVRDFFGVNNKEVGAIKSEFSSAIRSFQDREKAEFREKIAAIMSAFKDDTDGGN